MKKRIFFALCLLVTALILHATLLQAEQRSDSQKHADIIRNIPTPESVLGHSIGQEGYLTRYADVVNYFYRVDRASNRVKVIEIGKSTEGQPMVVAIVTSPENHARLNSYKQIIHKLLDPRKLTEEESDKLVSDGKPVLFFDVNMHSTEVSSGEGIMLTLYKLAAYNDEKIKKILDNTIVMLLANTNPDGREMVVDWYEEYKNDPVASSASFGPPNYQRYFGHDNNRDFVGFQLVENRNIRDFWKEWPPTVSYNFHQMGQTGIRIAYVPHPTWPLGFDSHPTMVAEWIKLGGYAQTDWASNGLKGYACTASGYVGVNYIPHGLPPYVIGHYGVGTFSESAGTWGATSVYIDPSTLSEEAKTITWFHYAPWPGGWWRLMDTVTYEDISTFAVLGAVADDAKKFLSNFALRVRDEYKKGLTVPPYAYVIPPPAEQKDPVTVAKMLNRFIDQMVEVHVANSPFTADGISYPEGTYVILMAQPMRLWANYLLKVEDAAPLPKMYDVQAWTQGYHMGVDVIPIKEGFSANLRQVTKVLPPPGYVQGMAKYAYIFGPNMNNASLAINRLLTQGFDVYWAAQAFNGWPEGTVIVPSQSGLYSYIKDLAKDLSLQVGTLDKRIEIPVYKLKMPRIALYTPITGGTGNRDEGETRQQLEAFEFPYIVNPNWYFISHKMNNPKYPWAFGISDLDIKAGALENDAIDVLIMCDGTASSFYKGPDVKYPLKGGLGVDGTQKLKEWIQNGGKLIGTGNGGGVYPIAYFGVNLGIQQAPRPNLWGPGSLLRLMVDNTHPIGYGMKSETPAFYLNHVTYDITTAETVAYWPSSGVLMSGMLLSPEEIYNKGAVATTTLGNGRIILIGLSPIQRGLSDATYKLVFNSIHYSGAEMTTLP